ncbi:MAG: protoporphyrinogen oxidase [Trueperaceae bacterium]|nr:protoporphyrinogen oxidase [Trueperaceae bacterium]
MTHPEPTFDAAVVGAGVSGLALAALLRRARPSWRIAVLEADEAPGGAARSSRAEGYLADWGPSGVLDDADGAVPLARALGADPRPADPAARTRWIYRDGGLRPLPTSPREALRSELLGPLGKAIALAEPWAPVGTEEESVDAFLARRFGRPAADALGEALVLGVLGGDPREVSLDAAFPELRAMERRHGSLLRAVRARTKRAQAAAPHADASTADAPPRPRLHGFGADGMQAFTDALAAAAGDALRTGTPVHALTRERDGWRLRCAGAEEVRARRVALAVPTHAAAELLGPHDAELADELAALPYAPMRVIALGYRRVDVPHPLGGFGYLIPAGRGARSLGVLFASTLFPGQAPEGTALLRVLAGGRRDPALVRMGADEALAVARRDLRVTLGVNAPPTHVRTLTWPRAIPQPLVGHPARVSRWRARAAALGPLALVGAAYGGAGVNACVRDARAVARAWTGDEVVDADAAPRG